MLLHIAALLPAVWWVALRLRLPGTLRAGKVWFLASTFFVMLVCSLAARTVNLLLPTKRREQLVCRLATLSFRFLLFLNPHIRIRTPPNWDSIPKRCFLLLNHTSWLDAIIFTAVFPLHLIKVCRTLLKRSLLNLPLGGIFFRLAGHFPVYFKKDDQGSWEVDQVKQAPITEKVTKFLQEERALLAFFPEGVVNSNPKQLQPFRRGSFGWVLDYDLPVWAYVALGNDECWPAGGYDAGNPADIDISVFKVCEKPSSLPESQQSKEALAELCRVRMQEEVDRMMAMRQGKPTNKAD